MKKYIIISLILIIPSAGFSKIMFNTDLGISIKKEVWASLYLVVKKDVNIEKKADYLFGYSTLLKSPVFSIEWISEDRKILKLGVAFQRWFWQYGQLFKNDVSLSFSLYDSIFYGDKETESNLSLETGWRF